MDKLGMIGCSVLLDYLVTKVVVVGSMVIVVDSCWKTGGMFNVYCAIY